MITFVNGTECIILKGTAVGVLADDVFDKIDEAGIDERTDFSDEGHLNTAGAEKVAAYLEKYITELL